MTEYESAYQLARIVGGFAGTFILTLAFVLNYYEFPYWQCVLYLGIGFGILGLAHRAVLPPSFGSAALLLLSFILVLVVMVGVFVHIVSHRHDRSKLIPQ